MKKALIAGITGQDGSYPAKLLLTKGNGVNGIKCRASSLNTRRVDHILNRDNPVKSGDRLGWRSENRMRDIIRTMIAAAQENK